MFYSVHQGKNKGIFISWKECEESVKGYPNAIFKKFKTKKEAEYFFQNGKELSIDTTASRAILGGAYAMPGLHSKYFD